MNKSTEEEKKEKNYSLNKKSNLSKSLNFEKILKKNDKKVKKGTVSHLIKSTTSEVLNSEDFQVHQNPSTQYSNDKINENINRIEGLIQSIIINQKNQIEYKSQQKIKDKYFIYLFIFIATIFLTIFITSSLSSKKATIIEYKAIKDTKYVLKKYVNLRAAPSLKGNKITILPPNSIVTLIDEKKEWKLVKYKDYIQSTSLIGWMHKENLKGLE